MKLDDGECPEWICHPDGLRFGAGEKAAARAARLQPLAQRAMTLLVERRLDVYVVGTVCDAEADYSFDDFALVRLDGDYYLLNTSGCSCPSPNEEWFVAHGPCSLEAMREHLRDEGANPRGYGVTTRQHAEFMGLVDAAAESERRCLEHPGCLADPDFGRACWDRAQESAS